MAFLFTDSPRLYTSTNPWKITATFHTISSTREEYITTIEELKESAPPAPKKGQKWTKFELSHLAHGVTPNLQGFTVEVSLSTRARQSRLREGLSSAVLTSDPHFMVWRAIRSEAGAGAKRAERPVRFMEAFLCEIGNENLTNSWHL